MQFDILTLFPEIFPNVLETSILGRAVKNKLLSFKYTNIRDYSNDKHKRVDDYPYGGGCGMVMQPGPIYDAYEDITSNCVEKPLAVFLSPRGKTFTQEIAKEMVKHNHIVLICGHYEGIDQRVIDEIADFELSVGDFVLTGGELGAMIVCDAVSRLVPGVLAEEESFTGESHYNSLLEFPQYTRPSVWKEREVPAVLLGGNQQEIDRWRTEQSLIKTETVRPDLFSKNAHAPYCIRSDESVGFFKLIAYDEHNKRDEVYKLRRKISRKFANQGFDFKEETSVFNSKSNLLKYLDNEIVPVIIVVNSSDEISDIAFEKPTLVFSDDKENFDSLYPYFALSDIKTACNNCLNFMSIIRVVKKYGKNI